MSFVPQNYDDFRKHLIEQLKTTVPEFATIATYATGPNALGTGELNWLSGDQGAKNSFYKNYAGMYEALVDRHLGNAKGTDEAAIGYTKLISSAEFGKMSDDDKKKAVDAYGQKLLEGAKQEWQTSVSTSYEWQKSNEENYHAYKTQTGSGGTIAKYSAEYLGGKDYVEAARAGQSELMKQTPLIKVQLSAEKAKIREQATAESEAKLKTEGGTRLEVDSHITDLTKQWDTKIKEIEVEGSKYGSRLQSLSQTVQGVLQLQGQKDQALGQLKGIELTSSTRFNEDTRTELLKSADQILGAGRSQATYQRVQWAKLTRDIVEYETDVYSNHKADDAARQEVVDKLEYAKAHKAESFAKFKEELKEQGKALPKLHGKDVTADDLLNITSQALAIDTFKEYNDKMDISSIKTVNSLKYKNNNPSDGIDFYLADNNVTGILKGSLDKKITSHKISKEDPSKYEVQYETVEGGKTVSHSETVDKRRVVAQVSMNDSGVSGKNYYVSEERANDIEYNSSGDRIGLFFGAFKKGIMNNPNLTEEEKDKKLSVVQNGLEAVMGGSQKIWGLIFMAISGQLKPFIAAIKETITGMKAGNNAHGTDAANLQGLQKDVELYKDVADVAAFDVLKTDGSKRLEVTKETAEKFTALAAKSGKTVEELLKGNSGGVDDQQSVILSGMIKKAMNGETAVIEYTPNAPANSTQAVANSMIDKLDQLKKTEINEFINSSKGKGGVAEVAASLLEATKNDNVIDQNDLKNIKDAAKNQDPKQMAAQLKEKYGLDANFVEEILGSKTDIQFSGNVQSGQGVSNNLTKVKLDQTIEQIVFTKH